MSEAYPWEALYPSEAKSLDLDALPYGHLSEPIRSAAKNFGDRDAATTILPNGASATITYTELDRLSDNFAVYLREHLKLGKGDVVATMSANCIDFAISCFGVFKAGCIATNINPLYTADEMGHQLSDSGAKALVILDLFGDKIDAVVPQTKVAQVVTVSVLDYMPPLKKMLLGFVLKRIKKVLPNFSHQHITMSEALVLGADIQTAKNIDLTTYLEGVTRDDTALFQYTGGTTGRSKGAELSHHNVLCNAFQALSFIGTAGGMQQTTIVALPLYHITAFAIIMFSAIFEAGHLVMVPSPRPPSNLKAAFEKFPPHLFTGINTLYAAMVHEPWLTSEVCKNLQFCGSGGAAQHEAVAEQWEKLTGVPILQGYGLTECAGVLTLNTPDHNRLGCAGIPVPGMQVKIMGEDGNEMPVGDPGELWAKGPSIMKGYFGHTGETASAITDGWLHTGDIATMDAEGVVKIVDRMKDMILVSGFNVYPNEIEDVIAKVDGVAEVGVIGVPDPKSDEVPKAYIVKADPSLTAETVIAHCHEHLTRYKVPKHITFVDDIPKSLAGKVLRKDLRQMEADGGSA